MGFFFLIGILSGVSFQFFYKAQGRMARGILLDAGHYSAMSVVNVLRARKKKKIWLEMFIQNFNIFLSVRYPHRRACL